MIVSKQERAPAIAFLFYNRNKKKKKKKKKKKLVPRALLSYISTWEFSRTPEKCEKHSPSARAVCLGMPVGSLMILCTKSGTLSLKIFSNLRISNKL